MPVRLIGHSQRFYRDEPPPQDTQGVAVNRQDRRQHHTGQKARHDQNANRISAHDAQGIELLGHVHRSQFRRQRPPRGLPALPPPAPARSA